MMLLHYKQSFLTMDNQVEIFTSGKEKFAALFGAIGKARDHIHLESYIVRNDTLGRELVDLLSRKAEEGLEVRLLLDGLGSGRLPRHFFDGHLAAGGKVAYFFPSIAPLINPRMNYGTAGKSRSLTDYRVRGWVRRGGRAPGDESTPGSMEGYPCHDHRFSRFSPPAPVYT